MAVSGSSAKIAWNPRIWHQGSAGKGPGISLGSSTHSSLADLTVSLKSLASNLSTLGDPVEVTQNLVTRWSPVVSVTNIRETWVVNLDEPVLHRLLFFPQGFRFGGGSVLGVLVFDGPIPEKTRQFRRAVIDKSGFIFPCSARLRNVCGQLLACTNAE
jgi:hypothetical protein